MERTIKLTGDGSKTLFINAMNEGYHSGHGALQEAVHVFIENGFKLKYNYDINILELGFGTGLNVLVTIDEYLKTDKNHVVRYFTLEKYPVRQEEIELLDYPALFPSAEMVAINAKIHNAPWNTETEIVPGFYLTKFEADFFSLKHLTLPPVHLVYFDCFGARVQPDLWEKGLFSIVAEKMADGGLLTTYSSKGSVRRILQELGFEVTKKPGPPGKREMINAIKRNP